MTHSSEALLLDEGVPVSRPDRWRLSRAGIVNVWHYLDTEFALSGGRMILRGTNGSGKSRALEMLLPFLLDADRKRMDATGAAKVDLDELMRTGSGGQTNRIGYLWIELARPAGHLTIGAHIRYSATAHRSEVHFFTSDLRVGHDLQLVDDLRSPLSRDDLAGRIGADRLTREPERHRDTVRDLVFGLRGEGGRDRYTGLLQLLHTLRSPDVGNRIDEGRLPQILSDALPPLADNMLLEAGSQLDLLGESRGAQAQLEASLTRVRQFHAVYRRYAADLLRASAEAAVAAADRVSDTERELAAAEADAADLDTQAAAAETRLRERRDQLAELERAMRGLETHELFRTADDLAQRQLAVDALGLAADQAISAASRARAHERLESDRAGELLDELSAAVGQATERLALAKRELTTATVPHGALPADIRLEIEREASGLHPIRTDRDATPESAPRPTVARVKLVPEHCEDARAAAEQAAAAARRRREQATRRLGEARRLDLSGRGVREAEATAERAAGEAERDAAARADAAARLDDAALSLRHGWREWLTSDSTSALLPDLDAVTLMRRLSAHLESVTDIDTDPGSRADPILSELAALPAAAADAAPEVLGETAVAPPQNLVAESRRRALTEEQAALESDDGTPEGAPWQSESDGVPLWQAVEFADTLGDDDRIGIEAALLAAGFLTATVDGEGRLRAHTGQVLVSPRGELPRQPLSTVLVPSPDTEVPLTAITAVLSAIGFEDAAAVASVSRDGRWHNGVLRGRHTAESTRYIGAAARDAATAARRIRIDEITADLAALDLAEEIRTAGRGDATAHPSRWYAHTSSAPTTGALDEALHRYREADRRARSSAAAATELRKHAATLRSQWSTDLDTHRATCLHFALPRDVPDLEEVVDTCAVAEKTCLELARDIGEVLSARARFTLAVDRFASASGVRVEAEENAESCWHEWHGKAAVVAAQAEALDVDTADLARELRNSDTERARTEEQCRRTVTHREHLGKAVAEVLQRCATVRERLRRDRDELTAAAGRLSAQVQLPEISAAADVPAEPLAHLDDPDHVRTAAQALLNVLPASTGTGDNRILAALQRFDRDISDRLEVRHTVTESAHVVGIGGVGDDSTPTGVLAELTKRAEDESRALSQRERDVFTGFVLGGVADELRRRITQAEQLVAAMNTSLAGSRTTHGIGVRIAWRPVREDADAALVTRLLTGTRSPGDSEELLELLRRRVEASHATDPSAGYATHLSEALDYRKWHTVEVTIVGPEPDQERRISTRAKISQGETRFVSYVSLFAAADGYLSGLPDTDLALRLVLLDDAFAKIDEPTIGELMGLLVRQDIDFVMTGHALWGCVPGVPALDIYEVRRLEDGSAVTTRVHWDGRNRLVRPAES
ncbi:TIGR02680 family protein [Rhodococcus coprophilus]|uniref:TIGR02680 family protein n=1 Tax=Rhodococcus coprophilus TaxID=38310 RepID=UPI0037B04509